MGIDARAVNMLRQQGTVIIRGLDQWQLFKYVAQVAEGLKPIGLGSLDQTEESGAGGSPAGMAGEQPVLAGQHEGSNGVFGRIVVRFQKTVVECWWHRGPIGPVRGNGSRSKWFRGVPAGDIVPEQECHGICSRASIPGR